MREIVKQDYKFKTDPYDHQAQLFYNTRDLPLYALLWEQGTGKTKVIIDTVVYLYNCGKIDSFLIIAPNGVHHNWIDVEIPIHLPDYCPYWSVGWETSNKTKAYTKKLHRLFDDKEELKILAMNVESYSTKRGREFGRKFVNNNSNTLIVVDESSRIKSHKTNRTKAIVLLGKHAKYKRILTGTPVTKWPLDLFTQFQFLDPEILYFNSFYTFKHHYADIKNRVVKVNRGGRMVDHKYEEVLRFINLDEMKRKIDPYSHRITKKECLDLPSKIYMTIKVEMSPIQKKVYKELKVNLILQLVKEHVPIPMVLTRLLRLQQITGGFVPIDEEGNVEPVDKINAKISALLYDIKDVEGSVIIWARFRAEIKAIYQALIEEYGYNSAGTYFGETSRHDRKTLIASFQDKKTRFFIGNPQSAGLGLTLTAANTVYYYSNDFNLENRLQSEDRCHRIGQHNPVVYKDLICPDTVDIDVVNALRNKKNLADIITGDSIRQLLQMIL
ncbi:DEAD/DEAH box helicase [candidate division KSB1 bacterium]|nr:DEAD/DEAH box helicase [candidate division KSB1 bacterium]